MKQMLVICLLVGIVVKAQIFPGSLDDKLAPKEGEGGSLGAPGSPSVVDDPNRRDPRLPENFFQFEKRENETESKPTAGYKYVWDRNASGSTVFEKAFVPNGTNMVIMKSKDRALEERNITRATSVYNFVDAGPIVAIIPWGYYGPCLIRNTSLTFLSAVDLLTSRNGSSVQSTTKLYIDANVAPLSNDDAATFFVENPVLKRWCSFRPIVITADFGDNKRPYSNSTEEILTFALEADINIIVPERPELPDTPTPVDLTGPRRSVDQATRWGFKRDLLWNQNWRQNRTQV